MTVAPHQLIDPHLARLARPVEVTWSRTLSRWSDAAPDRRGPHAQAFLREALIVRLEPADDVPNVHFSAWIERRPSPTRVLHDRVLMPCRVVEDGRMVHVELGGEENRCGGQGLFCATFGPEGEALFARSTLLRAAGFPGGGYDRAVARHDGDEVTK